MLTIALDIRPALRKGTGVGTFVEQLALSLDQLEGDHHMKLFSSSMKDRWQDKQLGHLRRSEIVDKRWPVKILNTLWHWFEWPPVDRFVGTVDIAHSPNPLVLPSRGKTIVTIHDLYFITHPESTTAEISRDYTRLVRKHCASADGIVAVSEATAREAIEHLGIDKSRIRVCWEDAARVFNNAPTKEELAQIDQLIPNPFFLFVGTIEPRKNLSSLLKAFDSLTERHDDLMLVIAGGKGWGTGTFDSVLQKLRHRKSVWISGYRDRRFLRALYHKAVALVMPSHCEGFGLPLVEAMACGCPLIVANNSAMPEVAGDAAVYWNSKDPEELAGLMEQVLQDQELRNSLITRGRKRRGRFSWGKTAERVMQLYQDLAG
jgi:glycosyltransferase involved in cell wall biosynthesis